MYSMFHLSVESNFFFLLRCFHWTWLYYIVNIINSSTIRNICWLSMEKYKSKHVKWEQIPKMNLGELLTNSNKKGKREFLSFFLVWKTEDKTWIMIDDNNNFPNEKLNNIIIDYNSNIDTDSNIWVPLTRQAKLKDLLLGCWSHSPLSNPNPTTPHPFSLSHKQTQHTNSNNMFAGLQYICYILIILK